jgi:hypothetical protein
MSRIKKKIKGQVLPSLIPTPPAPEAEPVTSAPAETPAAPKAPRKPKAKRVRKVAKPVVLTPEIELREERDVAMFKDWLMGKSYDFLGEAYKMSRTNVGLIAKKYNWKALKKELRSRQFNATIDRIRDMTVTIQNLLEQDAKRIVEDVTKEKRMLTKSEREHLRSMYDRVLKEIRLDEGKPTELGGNGSSGKFEVELRLPPGVKSFGIIPPDPRVKMIETQDQEKKPTVDLDDIEDEVGEIK